MDIAAYTRDKLKVYDNKLLSKYLLKELKKELSNEKKALAKLKDIYNLYSIAYITSTEARSIKDAIDVLEELTTKKSLELDYYSKKINKQNRAIEQYVSTALIALFEYDEKEIVKFCVVLGYAKGEEYEILNHRFLAKELAISKYVGKSKELLNPLSEATKQYIDATDKQLEEYKRLIKISLTNLEAF